MRTGIVVALLVASLGLGACRREVPYEPLKLGGPTATTNGQSAR